MPDAEKTLEQLAADLDLDLRAVPVDAIDPTPGNPNELDDRTYESLKADIRDNGFTQPVLVREGEGGRYRMIDGEHRWKIVVELGFEHIPAVVLSEDDDDEAMLRLLTMNGFRGQFVPIKLAYVLADLAQRIPEKELRRRLGMEPSELRDHLRLATFTDPLQERLKEEVSREAQEAPIVLKFIVSKRDAQVVERVIDKLVEGKIDRGTALAKICRAFEKDAAKP